MDVMVVRRAKAVGLVLGPVMMATSTFFWVDGEHGATGGTLAALSLVPWAFGLLGEYDRLRGQAPRLSAAWLLFFLYGVLGGVSFGLRDFYDAAFHVSQADSVHAFAAYPLQAQVILWLAGPAFPLSLLALAGLQWVTRRTPRWATLLLAAGAVAFPASRIPRIELVAHVADFVLVAAFAYLAWLHWARAQESITPPAGPRAGTVSSSAG
ncbi:hypothetical protein ACQPZA_23345 [Pseudonocardia xinjiangensis]|uniref:hypothetical protein n=1 Tax=Pseudonocardia xinjiangensis TaxID=75289 RepID=UPI003D9237CE